MVKKLYKKGNSKRIYLSKDLKDHNGRIRSHGSFLLEEFIDTRGIDVKVYTVGSGC